MLFQTNFSPFTRGTKFFRFYKYSFNFINQKLIYEGNRLSSSCSLNISGIYPPVITNFDDRGNVLLEKLSRNLQKWNTIPFKGYVVLGSTGEFTSLNEEEKISLVKTVKVVTSSNKLVIAGSGCESTAATIKLTNKMADAGANAALVISPFFYKGRMTDDTLYSHYIEVADCSKIPIILYSVPANTGIDLTSSLVSKLADHPNIIGLKDSGGDITKIAHIVHKTKSKDFQVLAGSAGFLYPALCIGCVGGVLALANPLGKPLCDLYQHTMERDYEAARELQHKLIGPNLCVTKLYGIAGVKKAMDLAGFDGGPCRPPLKDLLPQEENALKSEFEDNGFL